MTNFAISLAENTIFIYNNHGSSRDPRNQFFFHAMGIRVNYIV
ncbi:MAG: hypothetical protein ACRCT1_08460 [Microcoleaceae cyanobacterium]